MSALGLASLGTQCTNRALGMASLGVFCGAVVEEQVPNKGGRVKGTYAKFRPEKGVSDDERVLMMIAYAVHEIL